MAANAIFRTNRYALNLIVKFQNLLGAYSDTEATSLAPFLHNFDVELLRQKTHLPSTLLIDFFCQPRYAEKLA